MKATRSICLAGTLLFALAATTPPNRGQERSGNEPRESLISAAREIMESAGMCALVTVDQSGQPRVRTMDPFPPQDGMIVWLGTNRRTRKVEEIRRNPGVTLYYAAPENDGYVSIYGRAQLVDDPKKKAEFWKDAWEEFYRDRKTDYLLIKVTPDKIEVVSYSRGLVGNPQTWAAPQVEF